MSKNAVLFWGGRQCARLPKRVVPTTFNCAAVTKVCCYCYGIGIIDYCIFTICIENAMEIVVQTRYTIYRIPILIMHIKDTIIISIVLHKTQRYLVSIYNRASMDGIACRRMVFVPLGCQLFAHTIAITNYQ